MTAVYVIVAVLVFGFLIMIHELGHYTVARLCGVHIDEFSIGMGPKLYQKKTKKHGTLFSLRALPIGGYVSMKGESTEDDDPDSFSSKKVWQRIAIVAAGALMNLLLGLLIVFIIVCTSKTHASTQIHHFVDNATSCAPGGLEAGDTVLQIGNVRVHTGDELTYEILNQGHKPVDVTVNRDGQSIVLHNVTFPNFEEHGAVLGNMDFYVYALESPTFAELISITWHRTVSLVKMVWDSLYNLISGRYSVSAVSSPIGVTVAVKDVISSNDWSAKQIVQYVLQITSLITVNLGVFNLIPFPALDGGRLVFLVFEGVTRKRVSAEIEGKIHFFGILLLMAVMLLVVGKDIFALF